ncbi:hypothetical protein B7R54_11595 [Subtercola boreus]|uniref:Uncharacterized protein n=1 Tax=Subtercola boreus TaxID=120213 RepID=A0A3E0VJG4_9MICO|nr:hypothetical protein [Subtercola boreus]RFA09775.1 hypothetical protein B7R54_11595 [Subtercola boreus]
MPGALGSVPVLQLKEPSAPAVVTQSGSDRLLAETCTALPGSAVPSIVKLPPRRAPAEGEVISGLAIGSGSDGGSVGGGVGVDVAVGVGAGAMLGAGVGEGDGEEVAAGAASG